MQEMFNSLALSQVLLCVIRGQNYSAVIARELGYSQPAAVQNLKRLEKSGLIKSYREGGAIKYKPKWKEICFAWADLITEIGKSSNFNTHYQPTEKEERDVAVFFQKREQKVRGEYASWLVYFTSVYLSRLAKSNLKISLFDAFTWIYSKIIFPEIIDEKKFAKHSEKLKCLRTTVYDKPFDDLLLIIKRNSMLVNHQEIKEYFKEFS